MKRLSAGGLSATVIFLTLINFGYSQAQEAPRRVRGTIERVDGTRLAIKTREGAELTVQLKEGAPVLAVVSASLADIKPGLYVGIAGRPQPDGTQRAMEVHIFPEAMRGLAEGHRPWDLEPGSTMTNGSVAEQVTGVEGQKLMVKYKDGEKSIEVAPDTKIVAFQLAAPADLKPGEKVFIAAATKLAGGNYEAARIAFGKDGLTPPM
ncbi:MAG: hypothetical protein ACLP7P_21345 [Rhodomicrobium sp.]